MSMSPSSELGRPELVLAARNSVVTLVSAAMSAVLGFALIAILRACSASPGVALCCRRLRSSAL